MPAAGQVLPQQGADVHLGVGTCSGSTCHGAVTPWRNSPIQQNEYIVWHGKDAHSKAYARLNSDAARRIAQNLGLPNAHEAKVCLDCHADNVAPNLRARSFQISDGVGCEACHGGSVRWLGTHIAGTPNRAQNLANGMYPTEDPAARARLCLSCHLGTKDKFVSHQMLGAGHPRLPFELDTFTVTQPAHFRVDGDYRIRKRVADPAQTWAIGQAVTVQSILEAMADPARNRQGAFPELSFFDCHACHHPMSNVRWAPQPGGGPGPGRIRLADGNMLMLRLIAAQVDPALSAQLQQQSRALHDASQQSVDALAAAAVPLRETVTRLLDTLARYSFNGATLQTLLREVLREGEQRVYGDYLDAEQATMAVAAILATLKRSGQIDDARFKRLDAVLDRAYKAVERDETFKAADFAAALAALNEMMGRN